MNIALCAVARELRIADIARIVTDRTGCDSLTAATYVSTENMQPNFGGIVNASSLPTTAGTSFRQGDVLISNIHPYFKKIWFARFNGGCSTDVICLRVTSAECLPKYLFYQLNADNFIDTFVASSKGTKMPRADKQALLDYKFCLPNLAQQKHIVDPTPSNHRRLGFQEFSRQGSRLFA
jgi:type I restriction enzyme S subunit